MKFKELAINRFSCRHYKDKPVEDKKLNDILDTARYSPSAVNIQPWHFIVVKKRENLDNICSCYKRDWLKSAPVIIIVCGDHDDAWRRADGKDHTDIDVSIAITYLMLAATEAGLATCCVCNFDVMKCNEFLNLPSQIEPIALIPLGYPDHKPDKEKDRKQLKDIIHNEAFNYKVFEK